MFNMLNSWKIADLKGVELPEDAEKAFKEVTGKYPGIATNTPVLYCGSQIVKGINHMIIYVYKPMPQIPPEFDEHHRYLNQIIINSFEGEYSVVSNISLIHEMDTTIDDLTKPV